MKIKQITETTTSGSIATVDSALGGTQSRGNPSIYGGKKVGSLFKGKKTSAPYANSINESAELSEAHLEEDDVIVVPGQGRKSKTGFVPHGQSRVDHEVEMARSDLFSAAKNAQQVYSMIKDVSEDEGLDGWVQEKIIKANDYLNTIREYLEGKQVQGMNEQGMAEESSKNKYSNLSNRGVNRGIKRAGDDFNRMLDLDQAESPHYKTQHQQDIKQRLKTKPMAGPKGVLPEQGVAEGEQRVDSLVTDALKIMRGAEVSDAVRALTTVLGNREYNSRRGYYNFYIRQMIDMYGQQGVAEGVADMHSDELLNTVRDAIRKAIKETGDQSLSKIFVCLRSAIPASEALKNITSPISLEAVDNALQEVGIDFDDLLNFINKQAEKYGKQGVAEGAKVDRMVKHIEKSEEKSGKSKKEAENIAWATANKRGMLNNKNKKA
jgi:uncharacterized protein YjgD (DUF1641 family)